MLVYVPHKMRNYAFLLRSRAKQKYTNKCDARAKLFFCLLNLLFFPRSRCPPYRRIDVNCQNWPIIGYRVFPPTWPASMQIYWNRRKSLHKKIVQLPQNWFGTPTWPPFHCFGTPIWPLWSHVKTRYIQCISLLISWHQKNDIDSLKNIQLIDVILLAGEHRRISSGYFFPLKKFM